MKTRFLILFFLFLAGVAFAGDNARFDAGDRLMAAGRYEQALDAWTRALVETPDDVDLLLRAGIASSMLDDGPRAEQYLLDADSRIRVLASALFRGKTWPVAWVKPWGKGKVFYLALGHDAEACANPFFADILKAGVAWAADPAPDPELPDDRFAIA